MMTCLKHAVFALLGSPLAIGVAHGQAVTVRIRVLNGRTGKPIAQHWVSPRIEPPRPHAPKHASTTDINGIVALTVPLHTGLNAIVGEYPTCRYVPKADRAEGPLTFPVDQILATGVVEANSCSHRTVAPTPGELTLFVRPLHWWDRLSD